MFFKGTLSGMLLSYKWPATGFADTWLRAMMLNEVQHEEAEV